VAKVCRKDVLAIISSGEDEKARMLANFDADVRAASSKATTASTWKTWSLFHVAWFGPDVPVVPLTPGSIRAVGACFKEGRYKVFVPYMTIAKEVHVLEGWEWSTLLEMCSRKAAHSVTRGVGMARQSKPFDLSRALAALAADDVSLPPLAPLGWQHMLVIGVSFIMREIELAFALAEHVTLDEGEKRVSLLLPVSKKDPRAVGCSRSWSCLCPLGNGTRSDCPFHAAFHQLRLLEKTFGVPLPTALPLFPTASGRHVDKAIVISALEATIQAYGEPVVSTTGGRLYGGHSFRVTGAEKLASLGLEVIKIMVLARWAGETILRYVREAPLANLSHEVAQLEKRRDLVTTLGLVADGAETISSKISNLEQQLEALIRNKKLETDAAALEREKTSPKCYVTNGGKAGKNLKVHEILVDGADVVPTLWRARCGFRFAFCGYTKHTSLEQFSTKERCLRCGLGILPNCDEAQGDSDASATTSDE
jgi:hypothetical protein